jgi:O-antigen ligase
MAAILLASGLAVLVVGSVRTWRARIVAACAVVSMLALAAFALANTRLGDRVDTYLARSEGVHLVSGRIAAWRAGVDMLGDFPLTGSGFGSFRNVYSGYTPSGSHARWAQVHNDWLEVVLEGGVVTLVLIAWLGWGYARRIQLRPRRRDRGPSPLDLGLAIGIVSLAVHAVVDFNHQIPANAWMWVLACALAAPASPPAEDEA